MKNEVGSDFTATIERKEGRFYVLHFSDQQELRVPVHMLSRQAHEGDTIHLHCLTEQESRASKTELAQQILEQILNG
jgi:hypothetical protein